ncbi:PAS domain S-box protein [Flavobacterium sp.]|uniref:PAS domain S-box protein n=1 Tax=Flavobacterium sp. TaxID=239 RepID=UPI00375386C0
MDKHLHTYETLLKIVEDQKNDIENLTRQLNEKNNEKFINYIENAPDGVFVLDEKGNYLEVNPAASIITGYTKEELLTMKYGDLASPDSVHDYHTQYKILLEKGKYRGEFKALHKNGEVRWRLVDAIVLSENRILGFVKDITDKKSALEALDKKKRLFRALLENNESVISLIDENLNVLFRSAASSKITGWTHEEYEKISAVDYVHPDNVETIKEALQKAIANPSSPIPFLIQIKHKKGHYIWMEGIINNMLDDPQIKGIVTNMRDVTESKKAKELLKDERDKFAKIAQTSPGLIYSMRQNKDKTLCYPYASNAIEEIYGFTFNDIENDANKIFALIHPKDIEFIKQSIVNTKTNLVPLKEQYRYFHPTKGLVWHEVNSLPVVESEGTVICHGIVTDITNRILSDQKIIKANRLYAFISQINQMIVRTTEEEVLYREACNIAVEFGKFTMAWIGMINQETQELVPVMVAGDNKNYLLKAKKIFKENSHYSFFGPIGKAIQDGKYIVCNDIETDVIMLPLKEEALKRGYQSMMSLPIKKMDKVIGTFTFYATEKNFFDSEEILLLEEATGDVSFALDILEKEKLREKAVAAVLESEQRYHTITEYSPVGIFNTDANGATTYVNPMWCQISGLSFKEALGFNWIKSVHPEDRANLLEECKQQAQNKKEIVLTEYRFVRPDGSITWVMGKAIPQKNTKDEVIGFIGSITEITDRKNAEDEFKKINKKLESILDAIPDLLFEIGSDTIIYNYHSRNEDLLSIPAKEFIGKSYYDVLPPDAANICNFALKEAKEKGISIGHQYSLELPNGVYWFELSISPMNQVKGNNVHFICLSRDITANKNSEIALNKSEERYRGLLNNLDAGVIVHAANTSIILNNLKALELLGLTENEITGLKDTNHTWNFLDENNKSLPVDKYPVNIISQTRKAIKNIIIGVKRKKTNDVVWLLINGFPVYDLKDEINEMVISFIDITEQKVMEMELIKAKEMAESASKAKTDFLANMSHEIRTPLNGIIGFTHLLMESNLKKNQSQYMNTINESATSLMDIVNDILDFSKIESGKLDLILENISLDKLTNQIINLFKYQADTKKIALLLTIDKNVPKNIYVDSVRIKQILVNLLSNAMKFTNSGQVELHISELSIDENDYSRLKFSIRDTGIGIKLDNNKKIFSSFVQVDNSTNRKFGGTGLGLAITNNLLGLMKSKLELKSKHGEGSDFYFVIDLKKAKQKRTISTKKNDEIIINQTRPLDSLKNKNILIVEDNKINTLLIKTILKKMLPNVHLFEACDGNEALEFYKKEKIDAILMDIQMPNKNGYEATIEIRNLEKGAVIPIIALTAGIMEGDKGRCLECGMNDYLPKPIIKSDLEKTLLKWLI